jgi:hypothetical protein
MDAVVLAQEALIVEPNFYSISWRLMACKAAYEEVIPGWSWKNTSCVIILKNR